MRHVLCIADTARGNSFLADSLVRSGHRTLVASSVEEGLELLRERTVDLVILSGKSIRGDVTEIVERIRSEAGEIPVIVLAAEDTETERADTGGGPVMVISPRPDTLREAVEKALDACGLVASQLDEDHGRPLMIGTSATMRELQALARAVAPTRASILVEGESGTGKEVLVRTIHALSPRAQGPFVAVNCAALPEGLVESTLFGHERGAFTGASGRFIGAFERADGGTLLLDEISELRLDLQAKLLRAIQEMQFERVGGSRPVKVDVRVVATTNRDLKAEVEAGRFRSDLYYRLRVIPLRVAPLRERPEDVPLLARHFAERTSAELGIPTPAFAEGTLEALAAYRWPGNVRELEHAVERAVILNREGPLVPADFGLEAVGVAAVPEGETGLVLDTLDLRTLERKAIARALELTRGHRLRAARLLGISDRTLRNKLNGPNSRPDLKEVAAAGSSGPAGSSARSGGKNWTDGPDRAAA